MIVFLLSLETFRNIFSQAVETQLFYEHIHFVRAKRQNYVYYVSTLFHQRENVNKTMVYKKYSQHF